MLGVYFCRNAETKCFGQDWRQTQRVDQKREMHHAAPLPMASPECLLPFIASDFIAMLQIYRGQIESGANVIQGVGGVVHAPTAFVMCSAGSLLQFTIYGTGPDQSAVLSRIWRVGLSSSPSGAFVIVAIACRIL